MTNNKMSNQAAIEYLTMIMPRWNYENNLFMPPENTHERGELICSEPEGYAYVTAIEAMKFVETHKWHDIRKAPNNLPELLHEVLVCIYSEEDDETFYTSACRVDPTYEGHNGWSCFGDVIAWCEINEFIKE